MHRSPQHKGKSRRQFNGRAAKTSPVNMRLPLRGGIRL